MRPVTVPGLSRLIAKVIPFVKLLKRIFEKKSLKSNPRVPNFISTRPSFPSFV
jgi:hypothetical protein